MPSGMKRPRPRDDVEPVEDTLESYEHNPRHTRPEWTADENGRLPLKLGDGKFARPEPRMRQRKTSVAESDQSESAESDDFDLANGVDEDDDSVLNDDGEDEAAVPIAAGVSSIDAIKSFAQLCKLSANERVRRRDDLKARVAQLSQRIVSDPDHNLMDTKPSKIMNNMKDKRIAKRQNTLLQLQQMCGDPDPQIRKLSMLSCVEVFKNVLPGYRIRLPTAAELKSRVKKDVKKLRDLESAMLKGYQRYLKLLELTAKRGEAATKRLQAGSAHTIADVLEKSLADAVDTDDDEHGNGLFDKDTAAGEDEAATSLKQPRVSAKAYAKAKMAEKRAVKADKYAMSEYDADDETKAALGVTAVKCMCELMTSLTHFNFFVNTASFVIPRMNSRNSEVASMCCTAVEEVFSSDTLGEATLEMTRLLHKMVKEAPGKPGSYTRIHAPAIATLLKLRLHLGRESREHKMSKSHPKKKSRLDTAAEEDAVLSGLKAADAEALDERKKNSTAALKNMIALYFRVLRAPSASHLLPPVLQGLAKFAHHIDVGVVEDLLSTLKQLVIASAQHAAVDTDDADGSKAPTHRVKISTECALNCALTALKIMAGPGELLNADDTSFARFVYGTLLRLVQPSEWEHIPLAIQAVSFLLLTRAEYSTERVAAFARRCAFVALHVPPHGALALLSLMRQLCQKYPAVSGILTATFDASTSVAGLGAIGAGEEDPMMSAVAFDPEKAHALKSTAWELGVLHTHYHPYVRHFAAQTGKNASLLPSEFPSRIYDDYSDSKGAFKPAINDPKPHPFATSAEGDRKRRSLFIKDSVPSALVREEMEKEQTAEIPGATDFALFYLYRLGQRSETSRRFTETFMRLQELHRQSSDVKM